MTSYSVQLCAPRWGPHPPIQHWWLWLPLRVGASTTTQPLLQAEL